MKAACTLRWLARSINRGPVRASIHQKGNIIENMDRVAKMCSQKAVVIFSKSTCCMCHAIKRLFYEQGVSPLIHEVDEDPRGVEIERVLKKLGCSPAVPAVFIGGRLVGSANTVMTLQLDGSLKQMLKDAGALWL